MGMRMTVTTGIMITIVLVIKKDEDISDNGAVG